MAIPIPKNIISQQEYLATERLAKEKHEYFQGEIFAMSGASRFHNRIFKNLFIGIGNHLSGKKCTPYGSDMRVHVGENSLFTYPDITIVCDKEEYLDDQFDTLLNPKVIIEILSPSTQDYDRGSKYKLYRDIKSLQEYILVDSQSVQIERFEKNEDNSWTFTEFKTESDSLKIQSIDFSISLQDIYLNVFAD